MATDIQPLSGPQPLQKQVYPASTAPLTPRSEQVQRSEEATDELTDLSQSDSHKKILNQLTNELIKRLYGNDLDWINKGSLEGIKINSSLQDDGFGNVPTGTKRGLGGQRGLRLK